MKITRGHIATTLVFILSMGVGVWVAWQIGIYPTLNYCQDTSFACGAPNIRNVIPAVGGALVAMPLMASGIYSLRKLGWVPIDDPNAQ